MTKINQETAPKTDFFDNVALLIDQARRHVARTTDVTMCVTYYEIGRMIVEQEQSGNARAEYGRTLIPELSAFLSNRFGKGFSVSNLKDARRFYNIYSPALKSRMPSGFLGNGKEQIQQTASTESQRNENKYTEKGQLSNDLSKNMQNTYNKTI